MNTDSECPSIAALESLAGGGTGGGPRDEGVRAHIERCEVCAERLEEIRQNNELMTFWSSSRVGETRPIEAAPSAMAGGDDAIDGYEIVREIHRGGQGVVYEAIQRSTDRRVALKMLLRGALATSAERARFAREIAVVVRLRHPNVVTVYDSGVTPDGRYWFTMELVEGGPLSPTALSASGMRDRLSLFASVCDGVACAHQRGIIHRDLKPANILIDASGEPRVLDFGLAREMNSRVRATMTGQFVGTFAYAAPEQVQGDPDEVDTRTDVYGLGVILYELLTGRPPYPTDVAPAEVIRHIQETVPEDPSRDGVGGEVATILRKALSKEKERRYESAGALVEDVRNYLEGRPINARRDSSLYLLSKMVRRHRVALAVGVGLVVLLVAFSVTVAVLYGRAMEEYHKANEIRHFLEDTLASVEPSSEGDEVTVRALLEEAVLWVDLALRDQPEVEASMRTTIGNSYRVLGRYEEAYVQLDEAERLRVELFGARDLRTAETLVIRAVAMRDEGRLEEAESLVREVLEIRGRAYGKDSLGVAGTLMTLGITLSKGGDHDAGLALLQRGTRIRREALGEEHADTAMGDYLTAGVLQDSGQSGEALEAHERALGVRERLLEETHPDVARSLMAVGRLRLEAGDAPGAEAVFRRCVKVRERVWGDDDLRTARARVGWGRALAVGGRYEEAYGPLSGAYEVMRLRADDAVGSEMLDVARDLSGVCAALGRAAEAARWEGIVGG